MSEMKLKMAIVDQDNMATFHIDKNDGSMTIILNGEKLTIPNNLAIELEQYIRDNLYDYYVSTDNENFFKKLFK